MMNATPNSSTPLCSRGCRSPSQPYQQGLVRDGHRVHDALDHDGPWQARQGIGTFLAFYNHQRPDQALGYRTQAEVYADRASDTGQAAE